MDESKEKELEGVAVKTVLTTTETVIKKVVTSGEVEESQECVSALEKVIAKEEDGGGCDGGDVMVEVLGSEVVFDGIKRISGEVGSNELGCQRSEFSAVNDDDGGGQIRRVDESIGCRDLSATHADDLASRGEGIVTKQSGNIDKEKPVEIVAGEDVERKLGDAGILKDVEPDDNETKLRGSDNGNKVIHSTTKTTCDGEMVVDEEESLETVKREDKAVDSACVVLDTSLGGQDSKYEGDEQVVFEDSARSRGTVHGNEIVNGGVSLVEGSITGDQVKPVILDSVSGESENVNSKHLDIHDHSITAPEPDMQFDDKERLQSVSNEALTASVGHGNGALDETKLDETDMEIDAASGSLTPSENLPVDLKERREDIETNVIPTSLSRVSEAETPVDGMDIDAAADDANVGNNMVCETCQDDLKPDKENQVSEAVFLVKCNTRIALADRTIKSSDAVSSATVEKQDLGVEGNMQNYVENVSVAGVLTADLHDGSKQDDKSSVEGYADQAPNPDESGVFEGVIQEPGCGSDASHIECLNNHTTDGGVEQFSMGYALPNEGDKAKLLKTSSLDADFGTLVGTTANVVPEQSDELATLMNTSTNKDKTVKQSDAVIASVNDVAEVGSNIKATQEVQEEAIFIDKALSVDKSSADVFTQKNSNVEDMEEVQEETVEETPKELNFVPSAVANIQDETPFMDENVNVGPFIVETDDPDESVEGNGCVDVEYCPTHGENERSDAHDHYLQHLPSDPLVEGFELEVEDHNAKADSDMEDAENEQEESSSGEQVEEQGIDEERVSGFEKPRNKEEKNFSAYPIAESLLKDHRVIYQLPPEIEGEFSVSDLVWGKVKSHPWWPGQIFHPTDSSEKAMKYLRKDCYLVAYFGDRTFAWNEHSVLKPFRNHFSVAERQNKTESFQNAVECALAEVSRRTELGLSCSCVSQEAYNKIRYQMVENAGIKKGSSKRDGVDRCTELDSFQPDKLVEYLRSLAVFPTSSIDRLDLVIAKAQLTAFVRLQGIDGLAAYQYYEGISSQAEHEDSVIGVDSKITLKGPKRKHNLKDIVYQRRREKSMTELMGETMYYLDGEFDSHEEDDNLLNSPTYGTKRKTAGIDDFTKTLSVAKVSPAASSNPQRSFKVGDCIRRVANQLTGSSSILKGSSDGDDIEHLGDGADEVLEASNDSPTEMPSSPSQQFSLEEMLSQLHLCAQDPMKGYSFLGDIVSFFSGIRNMAVSAQRQILRKRPGRKQKTSTQVVGIPESFEFDDRNDSYWKDMVVQNSAEPRPARRGRKRKDAQIVPVESEKPSQSKPRKSSRKQYFHGPLSSEIETPLGDDGKQSQLPTELMLNFTGTGSIPSEMNLNKMFRSFGPLKESETEIDAQSNRARVVFKRRSDAEVAYSSAAMFNIFGSLIVNYQLNYTPSASFKAPLLALMDSQEKAT